MTRATKKIVLGAIGMTVTGWLTVRQPAHADPFPNDAGVPRYQADAGAERLEGARLDALLAEIAKARKGVRTMKAAFVQERKLTLLATRVKSSGELAYVDPDRLRWELFPPDDIVYFIGPEGVSYRTRSSRATIPQAAANMSKALNDLRALLGGDLALLHERYALEGVRYATEIEIAGAARDRTANVRGFSLTLDKSLVTPRRARLLEGKSDTIEIEFANVQINVPIDPGSMRP